MPTSKPNYPCLVEEELSAEELVEVAEDIDRLSKQTEAVRSLILKQVWDHEYTAQDFEAKPSLYKKNSKVPWWLKWAAV